MVYVLVIGKHYINVQVYYAMPCFLVPDTRMIDASNQYGMLDTMTSKAHSSSSNQ